MARNRPLEVEQELLEAFEQNGRVNEYLVSVLSDAIWRMPPPDGRASGALASTLEIGREPRGPDCAATRLAEPSCWRTDRCVGETSWR